MTSYLILSFLMLYSITYAQDDFECVEEPVENCTSEISGYKLLKANKISISGGKSTTMELRSVLSKGSTYILTSCAGATNMVVTLYDRKHKKIRSNYRKSKNKYYQSITYKCKATSIYYLKYEFENGAAGCGLSIIGIK